MLEIAQAWDSKGSIIHPEPEVKEVAGTSQERRSDCFGAVLAHPSFLQSLPPDCPHNGEDASRDSGVGTLAVHFRRRLLKQGVGRRKPTCVALKVEPRISIRARSITNPISLVLYGRD